MTEEQIQDKKLWFSAMIKYFRNEVMPVMEAISNTELSAEDLKEKSDFLLNLLSWHVPSVQIYDTKHIYTGTQPVCENYNGTLMEISNPELWSHRWFTRVCIVPRIVLDLLRDEPYREEGWNEETQEPYIKEYQIQPGLVQKAKDYFNGWENLTIEECQKKMSDCLAEAFYPFPQLNEEGKEGIGIFTWLEQKLSSDEIFT